MRNFSFLREGRRISTKLRFHVFFFLNKRGWDTPGPPAHPEEEEQPPQALPSRVRFIAHHPHPQEILSQNAKTRMNFAGKRRDRHRRALVNQVRDRCR